jgi:hypothetical protein
MKQVCISLFLLPAVLLAQEVPVNNTVALTVGIDHFGRSFGTLGGYRAKKQVGIFYWPWIGQPYATGVYDATVISAMPNGLKLLYDFKYLNDSISPNGQAHFWGQPLWGYYNSTDEWVIHRQIRLLTTAGIDFIAFDLTNRITYRQVYEKVLRTIEEFIAQGCNPPRAVFYTHSRSFATTWQVYNELYKPGLYSKAWYRVGGKPMIIAYTKESDDLAEAASRHDSSYKPTPYSQELKNFFYFKKPQWPFDPIYENGFPWIEWKFPQPLHGNVMSVTVASHPKVPMSRSITSGWVNWGRGWNPDTKTNVKEDVDKGTFFQRQWDHAIATDPDTVFVGGWNEWIAYKQPYGDEYMLCDAASKEYSRDIEPMRGGYEDAFYIQLIKNVRKYKGLPDTATVNEPVTININAGTEQWSKVKAVYKSLDTYAAGRHAYGVTKKVFYTLPPPANNLAEIRVAYDENYFYFLIIATKPFVHADDPFKATRVLIGENEPALKGWNGYQYLVEVNGAGNQASISRLSAGYGKEQVGEAAFVQSGSTLQIQIPRSSIGASSGISDIYFKVADGIAKPSDIMEYYISGSALPMGRLSYLFRIKS